jgi:selenocysteine-specific elongation factor
VQSAGKSVERAIAGQRTAVNLAAIEHLAVKRGMVLAVPGKFRITRRIDARIELLAAAAKMKQRSKVHFHAGAAETIAEVFFYGQSEMLPGTGAFAQLRLHDDVLLLPGDRFIMRQFSPVNTIGGGAVLDPLARRPMLRDTGRIAFLATLERGKHEEILAAMTERAPLGLTSEEITARTGWMEKEIQDAVKAISSARQARVVSAEPLILVSVKAFEEARRKIVEKVDKFQKENPLLPGIAREQLRATLGKRVRTETFRAALEELATERKLDVQGELVKRAGSEISLQPEERKAKEEIEAAFLEAGLTVPSFKEVLMKLPVEANRAEKLLHILVREKSLVRVTPELIFHREALAHLKERISTYKRTKGERISVPVFKELTGITRKYAIPLLEYLDRERVTRRARDERVIL